MSTAQVGDVAIGYDDVGSGDPLVLVHGHPFDRTMWRPQVERFSKAGWRVIAPDLRGYGETPATGDMTLLETFARDVAGLLDRLDVGEVVLAGLSMGGQIAMEFHRLFPERLRGLVLADTSPRAETEEGRRARNEAADRLLREGMGPSAEELLPKMVAPRNIEEMPEVAEHVMRMMRGTSPEGAAAALRGRAERPDYVEMLTRVAVPALVVVGTEDEFTPVPEAELIRDQVPDSTLVVIEGAGHMPNLERPAEFDAALDRFLAGLGQVAA